MPESYTLKIRRFQPDSGEPAYWHDYQVELDPERLKAHYFLLTTASLCPMKARW